MQEQPFLFKHLTKLRIKPTNKIKHFMVFFPIWFSIGTGLNHAILCFPVSSANIGYTTPFGISNF